MQSFLVTRADYPKTRGKGVVDEEKITKEIVELGEATRYTQIGSTLLKVLSRIVSDIVKWVISVIVSSVLLIASVWGSFAFPDFAYGLSSGAFILALFLVGCIYEARKRIRGYMFLRAQFYELSEKPSLSKAKDIAEELERRELVYA